jgi:2-C-methyl-D-erythritol 4-phosphate cytidylyltransferase/2-C-methyl-D-erythritol 2,4-cyclodiphosphate synthase
MDSRPRTVALIVAAGSGVRAGDGLPKQYRTLGGKSVLAHAIDNLAGHPGIDAVQVVIGAGRALRRSRRRPAPPPARNRRRDPAGLSHRRS